ncbi:MAG: polysaccharide deacetylase family protein [Desulfomonilia bacterium]|jgi:peptidoglycan/xylan/chitin deacetylase (PgdA/CDA1 family)
MEQESTASVPGKRVPILVYHKVDREAPTRFWVSTAAFELQMEALKELGSESLSLERLWRCAHSEEAFPENPVCITFDDGYENFSSCAFPILQKYGFTATVFLPTAFIGDGVRHVNDWDRSPEERSFRTPHLMWSEVIDLHRCGIEFGAHTRTHPDLEDLFVQAPEAAKEEIALSRYDLETRLFVHAGFLSYPYNAFGMGIESLVRSAGYHGAVSVGSRVFDTARGNWFCMDRIPVFSRGIDQPPEDARSDFLALLKQGIAEDLER